MRRQDAEAHRERLQRGDREHTYVVREQTGGAWEVVRTNIPSPLSPRMLQPVQPRHASTADDELDDAARRLNALRQRRARLANEPAAPADPGPFVARQLPGFG
jgi:hypothetical protein